MIGALRALLLALVVACCVACSAGAVGRDDLIGDFQTDYGFGIESLRLASDGHYDQLFRIAGEDTWTTNSGMWEFKGGEVPVVLLRDSLVVYDTSGKLRPDYPVAVPGVRTFHVKKSGRTISISDEAAAGSAFKKVSWTGTRSASHGRPRTVIIRESG
jgi:hypothetical protein